MIEQEAIRKNIRMSYEIADWYVERAKQLGVSQSNLMTMVLAQYIDQQKSLNMGSILEELKNMINDQSTPK